MIRRREFLAAGPAAALAQQSARPSQLWKARWIWVPGAPAFDYGVYHFRRAFRLDSKPASFPVHVTADNRYQFFVNGRRVSWGPARADLSRWRYETADLAPYLIAGENTLAAVVWNEGEHAAIAQITARTAFLLQGGSEAAEAVNTNREWRAFHNPAYRALPIPNDQRTGYWAVSPGEAVDGNRHPWGWEKPGFDDSGWTPAQEGSQGSPRGIVDSPNPWMLVPRTIPPMEERAERLAALRRAEGVTPPREFPKQSAPFTVPARTRATLLLDQGYLTTAFPELLVSGGKDARIRLKYAEALFTNAPPGQRRKGDRNDIAGKVMLGNIDEFIAGGGAARLYRPLFWRCYRYLELTVETAAEPLTIQDLRSVYTGYPFERKANFESSEPVHSRMLDIGWRTARLCAHETYMDCPYYEQLQYIGDARIQALVTLYNTGDTRLPRTALELTDSSRTPEGVTASRAPTRLLQIIPPFSLWWIGMLDDYRMYADDEPFVKAMLPGVRAILGFYAEHQKESGSLRPMPYWNYVDWVGSWPRGQAPSEADGGCAALDLQLLLAYQWAAGLDPANAARYRAAADKLARAIRAQYWDARRGLFADTPRKASFSQHANVLAVLARLTEGADARALMEKVLTDGSLTPSSIYFSYYLHEAMRAAGLGDRYLDMLGVWHEAMKLNMTTWPETAPDTTRSDCHAWSASPNIAFFRTILGIDSAAPGFRKVRIAPHPGKLAHAAGFVPHPKGGIRVKFSRRGEGLDVEIALPAGVEGEFVWNGRTRVLPPGRSTFSAGV